MNLVVGVDPGSRTGVSILENVGVRFNIIHLYSIRLDKKGPFAVVESVMEYVKPEDCCRVGVEIPNRAPYQRDYSMTASGLMGIGQNIERSKIIKEIFEREGFEVFRVRPREGWTKWKKDDFNKYFNYSSRTNEDERDAACHAVRAFCKDEGRLLCYRHHVDAIDKDALPS